MLLDLPSSDPAHESMTQDLRPRKPRLAGQGYAIVSCIFASLCGLFFGYDQGVTGGVLVMPSFLNDFCYTYPGLGPEVCLDGGVAELPGRWLFFTTVYNVTYYVGCILGAFLGSFCCDWAGRRAAIFAASLLFTLGTIWVITSPAGGHAIVLSGRVLEGVGVGAASFAFPILGAELAPPALRGMLSGLMQLAVVTGLLAAGSVNRLIEKDPNGWRTTNAVALLPPVILLFGIFCIPESPRWVYRTKGREQARTALVTLRQSEDVEQELDAIGQAIAEEMAMTEEESEQTGVRTLPGLSALPSSPEEADASDQTQKNRLAGYRDLWKDQKLRARVWTSVLLQLFQQSTGINAVFTYGALVFASVLGGGQRALTGLLVLQLANFCATLPSLYWVDRYGRRALLLVGAVGMCCSHLVAGAAYSLGCTTSPCDPATTCPTSDTSSTTTCADSAGWLLVGACTCFVIFFGLSWGPITWIYPAEIFPLRVRAKAVSLSTMANWTMGTIMIGVPSLFPYLGIHGVFFLFACLCLLAGVYVFMRCPETKGIPLEDMESVFAQRPYFSFQPTRQGSIGIALEPTYRTLTEYFDQTATSTIETDTHGDTMSSTMVDAMPSAGDDGADADLR